MNPTVVVPALREDEATRARRSTKPSWRHASAVTGSEIVVELPRKGGAGVSRSLAERRRPRLLPGWATYADGSTASADVTTRGPLGGVEVRSASGDVAVETVGLLRGGDGERRRQRQSRSPGWTNVKTASADRRDPRRAQGALWLNLASGDAIDRRGHGPRLGRHGVGRPGDPRRRGGRGEAAVGLGRRPGSASGRGWAALDRRHVGERFDDVGAARWRAPPRGRGLEAIPRSSCAPVR